ncbi:protein FAR1-RELATED SEQUENCE 11-like isoform X2 [Amborella trichopoda]|uniref:protein FAR1-RELATED SEQUENCE 11-like isoform X2 n=1 Tax=Amborella trichopoda TaxID=13333 RepID=UPI0009C05B8D|nr:protein FAR1-RELATED SEQUENCE 11-like isoform X2 [Amborella trichopoda]|eukprot:XP_020530447.1 protein FAR1-RELATED SEQUENCE 11-like isoform X2 [Amborella trichopoda]
MSIAQVIESDISYWLVVTFDNLHNHDVLEPQEVRVLPADRNISESYKHRVQQFSKVGICVRDMMRLFEIERSLKPGELPFIDKDIYNFVCAMNNANRDNDVHILLTKGKQMDRDKDFKYDFTVSEDNRLEHIVWSHGYCSRAYKMFDDSVVFDTTYRSTSYSMSFSIWVGVNNHGDTCLFGCVLLRDERVQSFSWTMKPFVGLMNGRMPQTILTDQDMALKEAICNGTFRVNQCICETILGFTNST